MHRVDGVVLDGQDVALADVLVRLGVRYLQRTSGTVSPAALELAGRLAAFASRINSVQVIDDRETAKPAAAVIAAESITAEMTAAQAAAALGVSAQFVRSLCRSGVLLAVRTPAGWRVDAGSAAALAARRKES